MNFQSDHDTGRIKVSRTHVGFTIAERGAFFSLETLAELTLKSLGLLTMAGATFLWFTPELPMSFYQSVAMTIAFITAGTGVYWYGDGGFRVEIQVDSEKRELRILRLNMAGKGRVRRKFNMREVESCFLKRADNAAGQSNLFLRLRSRSLPLWILSGPSGALAPTVQYFADIQAQPRRKATSRRISRQIIPKKPTVMRAKTAAATGS